MGLLSEKDKEKAKEILKKLENPVKVVIFTQEFECPTCSQARGIIEETVSLSDKIKIEVYDFQKNKDKAKEYDIKRIPAIVIRGEKDYGIRFYGIPSGYEYPVLLDGLIIVSRGRTNLSGSTKKKLSSINTPIHMKVFVLPTCPYCLKAAKIAHQFAIESDFIRSEMIEAQEFPDQVIKYSVTTTPKTIINEDIEILGAASEAKFVEKVLEAAKRSNETSR
jgi:glutaredoxin-like protein